MISKFSRILACTRDSQFSQKSRCKNFQLPKRSPAINDFDVKIFLGALIILKKIFNIILEPPIDITGYVDPSQHYA